MKSIRPLALVATAVLVCGSAAAEAPQPAPQKVTLSIEQQPLRNALAQFARQTGMQILRRDEDVAIEGLVAPRVVGTYAADVALGQLLSNTKLKYEFINARTVRISAPSAKGEQSTGTLPVDDLTRLASLTLEDGEGNDEALKKSQNKGTKGSSVEEMVVEGAREKPRPFTTSNLDLTRTENDALPFTTFTARDIELSGATDLQEFLANRLPQNFNEVVYNEVSGLALGPQTQINMHGWGVTETVFLLNGRRMAPQYKAANSDGANATPNLQGIPLRSIERIEILSSAGSAIYGANATGGVINIITRSNFQGGQFSINYSTPADVHAPTRAVEGMYAFPMGKGGNLRLTASYNDSTPLQVGDRSELTIERWRRLVLERNPARLFSRTNNPIWSATPNIRTVATDAAANLFGPGTANFTTTPDGYTGGGTSAAFTPGIYNLQLIESSGSSDATSKQGYMGTVSTNTVFGLGFDKNFLEKWRWSVDYRYSENDIDPGNIGGNTFMTVPAAAPTNPFGRDVTVWFTDPNVIRPELRNGYIKNLTWEVTSTLRGRVGEWYGFFDVGYTHNQSRSFFDSFVSPRGGWAAALLAGTYNPFVDSRVVARAAPSFYEDYIASRYEYASGNGQYLSTLKLSGPFLRLPAGAAQLTTGIEWVQMKREKSYSYARNFEILTGNLVGTPQPSNDPSQRYTFTTHSAYAEVSLPLLANKPLLNKLEFIASGRLDRRLATGIRTANGDPNLGKPYDVSTQASVYALGMRYDIAEGMAFRASQSIGFKPPSMFQIAPGAPPLPTATQTFSDPLRRNGTTPSTVVLNYTQFITGGNPNLNPETTNSKNIGFIFSPTWLDGLRLSVDYLENVRDDVIASLSAQVAVDYEEDLGRVTRGAPDGHPSGVGPITFLDLRQVNFRQIASKSVDFTLDQRFENVWGGRLNLALAATKNLSYKVQTSNTTPPVEQIRSLTSTFSQQIVWNGNGQVSWDGKQWGFGWSARYYDYIFTSLNDRLLQGSDRAPWKINHDAFVSYRMSPMENPRGLQRLLSGTAVTFGVRNVFDRQPRFWAANADRGVAPYDSIMGRSVWLQMRRDFN